MAKSAAVRRASNVGTGTRMTRNARLLSGNAECRSSCRSQSQNTVLNGVSGEDSTGSFPAPGTGVARGAGWAAWPRASIRPMSSSNCGSGSPAAGNSRAA